MKNLKKNLLKICFSLIVLFLFSAFNSDKLASLKIGAAIPKADVKMMDINGTMVSLNDVKGENGLLVLFSCNTCPYVKLSESRILSAARLARKNNIGFIILNSNEARRDSVDSFDQMKAYASSQGFDFNYAVDKNAELADAFGATRTPECFLFDKKALAYSGAIDDNVKDEREVEVHYLADAIEAVGEGKAVEITNSKSIGCSIKRIEK